jgi:hypothetical protein
MRLNDRCWPDHVYAGDRQSMRMLVLGEILGCADFNKDRLYCE